MLIIIYIYIYLLIDPFLGIGPQTALKLIQDNGSIDKVITKLNGKHQ